MVCEVLGNTKSWPERGGSGVDRDEELVKGSFRGLGPYLSRVKGEAPKHVWGERDGPFEKGKGDTGPDERKYTSQRKLRSPKTNYGRTVSSKGF